MKKGLNYTVITKAILIQQKIRKQKGKIKMENTIEIYGRNLEIKEYNNQRVVTFRDIDEVHQRPTGTARKRFNDNRKHFIEGEDYFVRKTDEAAREYGIAAPNGLMTAAVIYNERKSKK